jgi:hypothetical protein
MRSVSRGGETGLSISIKGGTAKKNGKTTNCDRRLRRCLPPQVGNAASGEGRPFSPLILNWRFGKFETFG